MLPISTGERMLKPVLEQSPVRHSRQWVVRGEVLVFRECILQTLDKLFHWRDIYGCAGNSHQSSTSAMQWFHGQVKVMLFAAESDAHLSASSLITLQNLPFDRRYAAAFAFT